MKTAQLGIELGTRHLRICTRDKEEFLKIKNMIAFDENAKLKAFGNEAFAMYEKQPYSIHVVKPMEHGVISDYTNMRYLLGTVLDHYFKRIRKTGLMIAVPVDITNVEKRAFEDLAWESASRVKDVTLVPKPILAAIGSGIDVNAPCGNMIIDIGASTTEISVISLGGIVTSRLLPYGGDQIDEWIRDYVKKNYKLAIGTRSARHLKLAYAKIEDKEAAMIKGRDLVSGLPKQEKIPIQIVEEKAHSQVRDICVQVKAVLESITPELASDIMNQGINTNTSKYKYKADDVMQQVKNLQKLSESTNTQLIWIASISLLVGGIGVMNIMLVSVTERTSEIGLKKAIGARKKVILFQFLTEASMLTSIGGVIGVIVGIALSKVVSELSGAPTAISIPAIIGSVLFSTLIGVIFGLLPSVKAADLNPIDALRSE